jgi:hypothetical protein
MNVNLGGASAGVAIAISVFDDYIGELSRLGVLPNEVTLQREFLGTLYDIVIFLDPPRLALATPANAEPYTRLALTGQIEAREAGQPESAPIELTLNAGVKLVFALSDDNERAITVSYGGVDGTPQPPLIAPADIDKRFNDPAIADVLAAIRISITAPLIDGLNESLTPDDDDRPPRSDWSAVLTLMPAGEGTVDSLAVTVGQPGMTASPELVESFVAERMGLAVAFNRTFLDVLLTRGAEAVVGTKVEDAEIQRLDLQMADEAIDIDGKGKRPVWFVLPDVDFTFKGPMVPSLVRGTTVMAFDLNGVVVDVSDSDEAFYKITKWLLTIGAMAMLFTGIGSVTALGILTWLTLVRKAWSADVDISNAQNLLRDGIATVLGAKLAALAQSLDDDTDLGELRIDSTPDSLVVVDGNMVLFAQVFVVPIEARMRTAEYSKRLGRFSIFELDDGRRFRAQELARLMQAGKVTVPGFHQVAGNYLRANPDDLDANNLLRKFKQYPTTEVVVNSRRS